TRPGPSRHHLVGAPSGGDPRTSGLGVRGAVRLPVRSAVSPCRGLVPGARAGDHRAARGSGAVRTCDRAARLAGGTEHPWLRRREVQIVFQDPYSSLDPRQSGATLIDEVLRLHGTDDAATRRRTILELADLVGLDQRQINALPRGLSGGQRQRVAIARALAA